MSNKFGRRRGIRAAFYEGPAHLTGCMPPACLKSASVMSGRDYAIAIETSSRRGGVALGRGEEILSADRFTAAGTHAAQLIPRLEKLLAGADMRPGDVSAVYVSVGPGGFTGLRVGIAAARTLAQAVPDMECVAVPTALALAQNVRDMKWDNLGVAFDAGRGRVYLQNCRREGQRIILSGQPDIVDLEKLPAGVHRPDLLTGPALEHYDIAAGDMNIAPEQTHMPTVEGLWRAARDLQAAGEVSDFRECLPIYARRPGITRPNK